MEVLRPFGVSLTGFKDITGTAADNLAQIKAALEANEKRQKDALAEIAGEKENSGKAPSLCRPAPKEVAGRAQEIRGASAHRRHHCLF